MKWHRVRFHANYEDSRPVIFPPPGPWWESGFAADESYSIVVAYFPVGQEKRLKEFWPEASYIEWGDPVDDIVFTDRFQKPDWWEEK